MVAALIVLAVGCAPTVAPAVERTLPAPLVATELPPEPPDVSPNERWTVAVEGVEVGPGDERDGVLFSDAMALRAAQLRVEYDRLRALYQIDQRTWAREREVYERHLRLGDEEIAVWRARAARSWWEINGDEISFFLGLALGAAATVGVGAVLVRVVP